jgi:chromosome partitioning protein
VTAKIITVCNLKGGSGKSTLSMNLAGTLARRGRDVLVVDADPQCSATRWAAAADDKKPFPTPIAGLSGANTKVHREVEKYVDRYGLIVIDTPPAYESLVPASALLAADLALVPVIPSPLDMWATVDIGKTIEQAVAFNEALVARLVINQCQPQTTLAREVLDILPAFGIEPCRTQIGHRTAFRQAAVIGGTVHDLGPSAAAAVAEIEALTDEVLELLGEPVEVEKAASDGEG